MKVFCSIFVMFVAISAVSSESSEEFDQYIVEQATLCQKENNASDKDVKDMLDGAEATTKIAKCLNACFMNKLGILNDTNKLVPANLEKIVMDETVKSKDGKTLKSLIKDIAEACKSATDADKCEAATKIISCLNVEAKKRGFDKNVF